MRQGKVYYGDVLAGIITEDEHGYSFTYDEAYLNSTQPQPVSLTLPLQREAFRNNVLFSFCHRHARRYRGTCPPA